MKNIAILIIVAISSAFNLATANTYYIAVEDTCASDLNNGTGITCVGSDGPFKTIGKGIQISSPGDTLLIGQGMYFEQLRGLNAGIEITFMPYGDGMVTLSAAMQEYTVPNNGLWTYEGTRFSYYHNTNFKVYYSDYLPQYAPKAADGPNTLSHNTLVDDNGRRFWSYGDSLLFTQHHVKGAFGEGVYFDLNRIYVAFEDQNKDPNTVPLYISKFGHHINVFGGKVTFDGGPDHLLTVDHSGRFGLIAQNGGQLTVRRTNFNHGNTQVYSTKTAKSALIEDCDFFGGFDPLWGWRDVKGCKGNPLGDMSKSGCSLLRDLSPNPDTLSGISTNATVAIFLYSDSMDIVRNNRIHNIWKGVIVAGDNALIENNRVWDTYDTAFETEEGYFTNCVIRKNMTWNTFGSHSGVTIYPGPIHVYENIFCSNKNVLVNWDFANDSPGIVWQGKPMKYWGRGINDPSGGTHYYYNTFYGVRSALRIGGACSVWSDSHVTNSSAYNNVFVSENEISTDVGREIDNVFVKSNLLHTTGTPAFRYTCWEDGNDYITNPPMPASWTNNLEADPILIGGNIDSVHQYFSLHGTSPARQANGFVLEPIPSNWPGASDLNQMRSNAGALEYEQPLNVENISLDNSVEIYPNPTDGQLHIKIADGSPVISKVEVMTILGSRVYHQQNNSAASVVIGLENLKPGLYLVIIELDSDTQITRKIIKR